MSTDTVVLFLSQTTPIQDFYLSQPVEKVVGFKIENVFMSNITTSGDALMLLCEQVRNSNPNAQSQVTDGVGALYPVPLVWTQAYPLPPLSDQLSFPVFPIHSQTFKNITLSLRSDGTLNTAGMHAGWIVTLCTCSQ